MPEFEVTTEQTTYQKGKPVVFNLLGDPQSLSFYSGEVGYNYALRDVSLNISIPIQGGTTLPKREYIYTFIKSGTYKVHFVAANTNVTDKKETVRELTLTITD